MLESATFTSNDKKGTFKHRFPSIYVKTSDSLPETVVLDAFRTEDAERAKMLISD